MLLLNHISITAPLHGFRIVIQLIFFSFYKKKLFGKKKKTLTLESSFQKNIILKLSDKASLGNTLCIYQ